MASEVDQELAGRIITIRQTKNPYVCEPQYIVYKKVALDSRGWLDLGNLGLPGEGKYGVVMQPGRFESLKCGMKGCLQPDQVREALEAAGDDVITVVDGDDFFLANEWLLFMRGHERRERNREQWRKVWAPVAQWIWGAAPGPAATASQSPDPEGPENDSGVRDDGSLEVVTERPNVLYGSGLARRQRGRTLTTD